MDIHERRRLVDRYREGVRIVQDALRDAPPSALDRVPGDGGWTARQVVHHLADSEMTSAIRVRRLLTEDAPAIDRYDEEEFARRLRYRTRPVEAALKAFGAARETTLELLETLADDEWSRAGTHPDHASYSVEDWLRIYADHAHDHAAQIARAITGP